MHETTRGQSQSRGAGDGSPFEFPARHGTPLAGVLCIHGFTGTPFEMRYLGERLSEQGFTTVGPALPGHGTTPEALDATTWQDWYGAVEAAFDRLRGRFGKVAVVGQSLGGLLALRLAAHRGDDMAAVCSLGAPLWLYGLARAAIFATRTPSPLGRWVRAFPKIGGSDIGDPEMGRLNPCYPVIPVRALHQLVEFMTVVDRDLPRVRIPTLIMHGKHDRTAPYICSEHIVKAVNAREVRHRSLERSYHLIAIDVERDAVAAGVGEFLATQLGVVSPGAAPDATRRARPLKTI